MKRFLLTTTVVLGALALGTNLDADEGQVPDFARDVAPIFTKYCTGCHNADDPQGDLSLETYRALQEGGEHGAAIVPGQAKSSRLVRVLTGAAEPKMPPEDNEAPTESEMKVLLAWIDAGAKGPDGEPQPRQLATPDIAPAPTGSATTAIAMSPQGVTLAVATFGQVELRGIGGTLGTLDGLPGKVNAVHFSQAGTRLVTASGVTGLRGVATLWNVAERKRLRDFHGHRDILYDAELSPDGKFLATCSYDRKVILWDVESGRQLRTLEGHNDAVYDLAFSPDGSVLATASGDETAKVWRVASGERLDTLHQPQAEQYVVTFSPDGQYILAGGADNRIRVWKFLSKTKRIINPLVFARFAHEGAIVSLDFSSRGDTLISTAADRSLKAWETKTYTELNLYERQPAEAIGVVSAPLADKFFVGRADGSVQSYDFICHSAKSRHTTETTSSAKVVSDQETHQVTEAEPNDAPRQAMKIPVPAKITGRIYANDEAKHADSDLFRFTATAGQEWMIEVNAARQKSPLDSKVEVLDEEGNSIPRVLLQAVRDSYFTFRGKDSNTSDDFRLHNWQEMELNQYLYADGEVVKLWHYPRGPDSGFQVYPGRGNRFSYFDTTPLSHALQAPCYIVEPHPPGTELIPNGLPVFPIYYQNDDDSRRKFGRDSLLTFTVPQDGDYLVRISDARSFEGEAFKYEMQIRRGKPDFNISIAGKNPTVNAGSGKELTVSVDRLDGFDGEIRVDIEGVPPGFHVTTPIVIEPGQTQALGTVNALPDAKAPTADNNNTTKITATATIRGEKVTKDLGSLGEIKLGAKPKLLVSVLDSDPQSSEPIPSAPLELTIAPGETISARVRIERHGFDGRVGFGKADAGRNLPHGVFVDNIGLNGLLIVEGQDERTFFITASDVATETTRMFHLQANADGNQTSWPVILHVQRRDAFAQRRAE